MAFRGPFNLPPVILLAFDESIMATRFRAFSSYRNQRFEHKMKSITVNYLTLFHLAKNGIIGMWFVPTLLREL